MDGGDVSDTGTYTVEPADHASLRRGRAKPREWRGEFRQRPQRRGFVVDSDDELEAAEVLGKKPRLHQPHLIAADLNGL